MTTLTDITADERRQVEEMARDIENTGVATIDLPSGSRNTGQRHRLRGPLQEYLGFRLEIGIDRDWDTGRPFVWFSRQEMAESPAS